MSLIALGVTGGIGAYKAVEIARLLQQRGHDVAAVMTRAARRFVGPVTFEAITRRRVVIDQFAPGVNADIEHIALASEIDLLLVAPATANIIGKFANGIADDFLSSLYLATRARVLLAPAMNTNMLAHEAVQKNVAALAARGVRFVEPGEGYLACGWIGKGRLAEPADVAAAADALVRPAGSLVGRTILVTAGPTYEDLDPVRYVGNRSSGRMGYAIAAEAARRGARVILVSGPTQLPAPAGPEIMRVRSAMEMRDAVIARSAEADAVIMAAAVADYVPEQGRAAAKLPKDAGTLTIRLVQTPDILAELGARRGGEPRPVLIGFAAETGPPEARGREKLRAKRADLIVANDVSRADAGFEVDTNVATLVSAAGDEPLPVQSKAALAGLILDRLESLFAQWTAPRS
jgi:phosphopantothenoylcysteine decarboxylase/phosphopantothenate--cysteine ligase